MPSKPDIWMPLYIGDYLAATAHLDAEDSGAYLHLLMHSWKNGSLPADPESLRRIAKVPKDAWSNAWRVLTPFFDFAEDGTPSQGRLERIREEWSAKQLKSKDKARKAAESRWSKADAPSMNSDAPSNAQAMLTSCPSPTSSPISKEQQQKQKPPRTKKPREVPTKTDIAKSRHSEFKTAILQYWLAKNAGVEMPWGPAEGRNLEIWLRNSPQTSLEQFVGYLRHRFRSDVNHTERPSRWIGNITNFAAGPIDRFNKPLTGGSNGNSKAADQQQRNIEHLLSRHGKRNNEGSGTGSGDDASGIRVAVRHNSSGPDGDLGGGAG